MFQSQLFQSQGQAPDVQEAIRQLQQQINDLQRRQVKQQKQVIELDPTVSECIPPHLQWGKQLDKSERSQITRDYPEIKHFPKAISDANGLASKTPGLSAKQGAAAKKFALHTIPKIQNMELDSEVLKLAALGWHTSLQEQNSENFKNMATILQNITLLAADNAQKLAKYQLQEAFSAADAEGAYALCKLESDESELVLDDHSVFQECHVQALTKYRALTKDVQKQKVADYKGNKQRGYQSRPFRGGRGSFRGRGGRGRGRGGRGDYKDRSQQGDPVRGNDRAGRGAGDE